MTAHRRRALRLATGLAAVLAAPVLAIGLAPAYADSTPLPSEPPGGATCAPGALTATCGQDKGTTGSSGGTKSGTGSGTKTGTTSTSSSTHRPSSGGTVTSLPRTGPADALPYGLAGSALLIVGGALVVGTRRRTT
jgi:LPXTG-motif cell wall-anchored protein